MRILSIGTKIPRATLSIGWDACASKLPTLGDYDLVLINLFTLNGAILTKYGMAFVRAFSQKFYEANAYGKTKFLILTSPQHVNVSGTITNYSIFPFLLNLKTESGEAFDNKPRNNYFSKVTKWDYCFDSLIMPNFPHLPSTYAWTQEVIATTRHLYPLAFIVSLKDISTGVQHGGDINFLPPQADTPNDICMQNLLDLYLPQEEGYVTPDFIEQILVPGEKKLREDYAQAAIDVKEATIKQSDLERELGKIKFKKGVLFLKGKALVRTVCAMLSEMGVNLEGNEEFQEDKMLKTGANLIPVEIRGHEKAVTEDDVRQVLSRTSKTVITGDTTTKGILIANPYALTIPSNRKVDFEPNIIAQARPWHICLLSTKVLFDFWTYWLKTGKTDLLSKLLHTDGPITH